MEPTASLVIEKMATMEDNPLEFDELADAWNTLCEQPWVENSDDFHFAQIENAAIATLSNEPDCNRSGNIGNEISRMLSTFDYPAFLVTADGRVAAINQASQNDFELNIGDKIDQLPYTLDASETISSLVQESLLATQLEPADALMKRAFANDDEREATIAITASLGRVPTALVFIITAKWKLNSTNLIQQHFGLTESETEVLTSFVDGYSSKDIAIKRNRSHATVRTQFQSILAKTGSCNQTELLRISLSLSDFSKKIGVVVDAVNHPHRRCAEIFREGGRLIEVTLMGDFKGLPILTFANPSNYRFNAQIEQHLSKAGLLIISICGPSCGRTDSVPQGETRLECMSADAVAIMNQLGIKRCPILAFATNSPVCYAVTKRMPDRISHIIQIAAATPHVYLRQSQPHSSWATAVIKAGTKHPSMKRMLFRGAMKAFTTVGTKQFMRLQLSKDCIEWNHVFQTENMIEWEYALKVATACGISAASEDLALSFEDWTSDVQTLSVDVTVLHGTQDTLFPIESTRNFVAAFPGKIELQELDGAGFTLIQSHPAEAVGLLRKIANTHKISGHSTRSTTRKEATTEVEYID